MPPPKAVTRGMLVLAIAALVAGDILFVDRKDRYLDLARQHRRQAAPLLGLEEREATIRHYHLELARRYERAAYRPWQRVAP